MVKMISGVIANHHHHESNSESHKIWAGTLLQGSSPTSLSRRFINLLAAMSTPRMTRAREQLQIMLFILVRQTVHLSTSSPLARSPTFFRRWMVPRWEPSLPPCPRTVHSPSPVPTQATAQLSTPNGPKPLRPGQTTLLERTASHRGLQ